MVDRNRAWMRSSFAAPQHRHWRSDPRTTRTIVGDVPVADRHRNRRTAVHIRTPNHVVARVTFHYRRRAGVTSLAGYILRVEFLISWPSRTPAPPQAALGFA